MKHQQVQMYLLHTQCFWGAEGAPILFSDLGFCMASCSYIYIYIYISIYIIIYIYLRMFVCLFVLGKRQNYGTD